MSSSTRRILKIVNISLNLFILAGANTRKYREEQGISYPSRSCTVRLIGNVGNLKAALQKLGVQKSDSTMLVQQLPKGYISPSLLEYDRRISKRNRSVFLKQYASVPSWRGVEAKDPVTNVTLGYGMVSPANRGLLKLSPVYGETWDIAMNIIYGLIDALPDEQGLMLTVPSDMTDFVNFLVENANYQERLRSLRSYTEAFEFDCDTRKIYSCTKHTCQPDC